MAQLALSVCLRCANSNDTSPAPALCPSCSSSASGAETEAEAELPLENIRTVLSRIIEHLPPDHALFRESRYQNVVALLREADDIRPPTAVTDFLNNMEGEVDTLNSQVFPNGSNQFQLVQQRDAFIFPLIVTHALSGGVLDKEEIYSTASLEFLTIHILFAAPTTNAPEQQRDQQRVSYLFEALLLNRLMRSYASEYGSLFEDALQGFIFDYVNSHQSRCLHLPPDTSLTTALMSIHQLIRYGQWRFDHRGGELFHRSPFIPNTVVLRHIINAVVLVRTINSHSNYIVLSRTSQPPVAVTIRSDRREALLETLRAMPSSNPEDNPLQSTRDFFNFLAAPLYLLYNFCISGQTLPAKPE